MYEFARLGISRISVFVLLIGLAGISFACQSQDESKNIIGLWEALDPSSEEPFNYILEVCKDQGDDTVGYLSIPALYSNHVKLNSFTFHDDTLHFVLHQGPLQMSFSGVLSDGEIEGAYQSYGVSRSLSFSKVGPLERSQTPSPPFNYISKEVSFRNRPLSTTFAGTLTYPKEEGKYPAIILISGTGNHDRDSKILHHKPFQVIADYFSRRGIAVLRTDDRGVGGTSRAPKREIADLTDDALCAVEYLRANEHVDSDRIVLVGHSKGGLTALDAAAKSRHISGAVAIAAPVAFSGKELMLEQVRERKLSRANDNPALQDKLLSVWDTTLTLLGKTPSPKEAMDRAILAFGEWLEKNQADTVALSILEIKQKDVGNQQAIIDFLRQHMTVYLARDQYHILHYRPDSVFAKLDSPVLTIFGEKDQQVAVVKNYDKALSLPNAYGISMETVVIPQMNHFLQTTSGNGSPTEVFRIPETVSPVLLSTIDEWLNRLFDENK